MVGFTGNQPPTVGTFQSQFINIVECIFITLITGNFKALGIFYPIIEMKTKYIFLRINQNITEPKYCICFISYLWVYFYLLVIIYFSNLNQYGQPSF